MALIDGPATLNGGIWEGQLLLASFITVAGQDTCAFKDTVTESTRLNESGRTVG